MRPREFFWKIFLGNTALLTSAAAAFAWLTQTGFNRAYVAGLTSQLRSQAILWRHAASDSLDHAHATKLQELVHATVSADGGSVALFDQRVTLVSSDGAVLADSHFDPATMERHHDRPEIQAALSDGWGESYRYSKTTGAYMRYAALRVGTKESPRGVIRIAVNAVTIAGWASPVRGLIWGAVIAVLVVSGLLGFRLSKAWYRPIAQITAAVRSLARGDLSTRVSVTGNEETDWVARSLNRMRDRLARHLETIDRQRLTLEALMAQLREGMLVADPDGRMFLVNPAAIRLLGDSAGCAAEDCRGLSVEQCVLDHDLQQLLLSDPRARRRGGINPDHEMNSADRLPIAEAKLRITGPTGTKTLLGRASDIVLPGFSGGEDRGPSPPRAGRVLVLTDLTELSKTIQMTIDFAANASHELRTPLSAIRSAVETLLSLDPAADAAPARHFLEVIARHTARLQSMVKDLLDLSRVESPSAEFEPTALSTRSVLEELRASFDDSLLDKRLQWEVDVAPECEGLVVNPYLLRLALSNLVENAIQFTANGGTVRVLVRLGQDDVRIDVIDNGCGIPPEEQERVFERFYQVQRARSGPARGTGLGLSIVRHAAGAMGGAVSLTSAPGQGTTVTLAIPRCTPRSPSSRVNTDCPTPEKNEP